MKRTYIYSATLFEPQSKTMHKNYKMFKDIISLVSHFCHNGYGIYSKLNDEYVLYNSHTDKYIYTSKHRLF